MYESDDAPARMPPGTKIALIALPIGVLAILFVGIAVVIKANQKPPQTAEQASAAKRFSRVNRDTTPPPPPRLEKEVTHTQEKVSRPVSIPTPPARSQKDRLPPTPGDEAQQSKAPDQPSLVEIGQRAKTTAVEEATKDSQETFPVIGTLLDEVVTGYETRRFQGFTFLLSTQAISEGKRKNGKPFRALQIEFDGLVRVLPPVALKHLRGILIWVEWDNIDRKNPNVLGKYYGGRIWRLDGSAHPLKSNAVEVLSLKRLTEEKAGREDKSRLLLLHELAHAVHHLALGLENPDVEFAYNQAMDRRLYEKVEDASGQETRAYAATNAAEYFAELTCAYLDRCAYFPFTRSDLKEHDPTGYRLMQKVWEPPPGKSPSGTKKRSK